MQTAKPSYCAKNAKNVNVQKFTEHPVRCGMAQKKNILIRWIFPPNKQIIPICKGQPWDYFMEAPTGVFLAQNVLIRAGSDAIIRRAREFFLIWVFL